MSAVISESFGTWCQIHTPPNVGNMRDAHVLSPHRFDRFACMPLECLRLTESVLERLVWTVSSDLLDCESAVFEFHSDGE